MQDIYKNLIRYHWFIIIDLEMARSITNLMSTETDIRYYKTNDPIEYGLNINIEFEAQYFERSTNSKIGPLFILG